MSQDMGWGLERGKLQKDACGKGNSWIFKKMISQGVLGNSEGLSGSA